jgi:predicted RNA-binding Zn-ribbon protein involved in translation (DUF1610 family)
MRFISHTRRAVIAALTKGEPVFALNSGSAGEDDVLIGTEEECRNDTLSYISPDGVSPEDMAWPEGWTLTPVTLELVTDIQEPEMDRTVALIRCPKCQTVYSQRDIEGCYPLHKLGDTVTCGACGHLHAKVVATALESVVFDLNATEDALNKADPTDDGPCRLDCRCGTHFDPAKHGGPFSIKCPNCGNTDWGVTRDR